MNEHPTSNRVIGYPLLHSKSPLLHNTVYNALNINAAMSLSPGLMLEVLMQEIKTVPIELVAVTMPFKQEVLPYLDYCSSEVRALKTANTIIQRNAKLYGYNTDVDGIAYALRNIEIADKKVLIIGAGGAAQALSYVMQKNNARIFYLNRSLDNALKMVKFFGGEILTYKQAHKEPIDIIVNTTPLGMHPNVDASPLPDYQFNPSQLVFDLIYNPKDTALLKQAGKDGASLISGMDMFIVQGLRQIELWMEKTIITEKMLKKIRALL